MVIEDEHITAIKEFEEDIKEKVNKGIIEKRQRIIEFSLTECAKNYFELYLHKKKLVDKGIDINHRWFSSKKIAYQKFPFEFPHKRELLSKMVNLEKKRNLLCYGKRKPRKDVEEAIKTFYELKNLIEKEIGEIS